MYKEKVAEEYFLNNPDAFSVLITGEGVVVEDGPGKTAQVLAERYHRPHTHGCCECVREERCTCPLSGGRTNYLCGECRSRRIMLQRGL